jgi:hypothetical protein
MIKLILFLVFYSSHLFAHSVIFKDGIAFSSTNMASFSENYLMYSFSNQFSTGLSHWLFSKEGKNTEFGLLKLNHLLWRHNGDASQANIYLHSGFGIVDNEFSRSDTREAYMAGVEADWETRVLYTSIKHYQFYSPALLDLSMTQARIGFSPVLSDFKDLQTWVMLQSMYTPSISKSPVLTPMLRFFYHNILWEFGASLRGEWMLNFMVHF